MTKYHCYGKEDEILDRLVGYKQSGYYIDIGAYDPNEASITKTFYERGWLGINVEPQQKYFDELLKHRPKDLNLNYACGEYEGTLKLHLSGGLTTSVEDYSKPEWPTVTVPMITLNKIWDQYVVPGLIVDILKVDVEGYEFQVLKGLDWTIRRPTFLCVECTIPNTTIPCYEEWDQYLLQQGYVFLEDNVVNRFYKDGR